MGLPLRVYRGTYSFTGFVVRNESGTTSRRNFQFRLTGPFLGKHEVGHFTTSFSPDPEKQGLKKVLPD